MKRSLIFSSGLLLSLGLMTGHASTQRGEQAATTERSKVSTGDAAAQRSKSGASQRDTTPAASTSRAGDGSADETNQAQLDAQCELARQTKLAPERARYIDECVATKQKPDRPACERYYADYGAQSGNRAPLYYDLPECRRAFDARKNTP